MKLDAGNPLWLTLSIDQLSVFLVLAVEFDGPRVRLDFRLTHQDSKPVGELPSVAAAALVDALNAAVEARVEQIRRDEYAAGYRAGRWRRTKRTFQPCTLTSKVF